MRKRPGIDIVVLAAILSLSMASPATAAPRVRLYAGETSQAEPISFRVAKTDAGRRFLREVDFGVTVTCEDSTTQEWGMGIGWGGDGLRLTEDLFVDLDLAFGDEALHLHGRIGQQRGKGTLKLTVARLTPDEQAQVCTTGDLTWKVKYERRLSRPSSVASPALDGLMKVRVGPDGEVSARVRSFT